ncbi:TetR/AcrR family transcriptional regulator [Blastococcus sp. SYSU D00695]
MATQDSPHDLPARPVRRWSRTTHTRAAILDAARAVFLEHGYTDANMADVVALSGSSTGSIYHHFGGKAELYIALWDEHDSGLRSAARHAVQAARAGGEDGSGPLFLVGARAYLEQVWRSHEMARLFSAGDNPPGFDSVRRRRAHTWIRQNSQLLRAPDQPAGRVFVSVLSSVVADGAWEVARADTAEDATEIIEATLGFLHKLAS